MEFSMEKYYLAALSAVSGIGCSKIAALKLYFGSAKAAYMATDKQLYESKIFNDKLLHKFIAARDENLPEKIYDYCDKNNISLITVDEHEYPKALAMINLPPSVLYVRGYLPKEDKCLGIVGSRKASPYGLKVAETFAQDLALAGLTIVSGGAKGIDSAAHRGALKAGGGTVAVLGCGIDQVYPPENRQLFEEIASTGAVVTEFAPGMKPLAANFPARNRIINGLSQGILLVEAAKKSGAMITADFALNEGRNVYCVPGNIFAANSIGPHSLIKDGAILTDRPEIILNDFFSNHNVEKEIELFPDLVTEETMVDNKVFSVLRSGEAKGLEELVTLTQMSLAEVSESLLDLQIQGKIQETSDRKYIQK